MKKLLLFLFPVLMLAKVHYVKVEPLERVTIKSSVAGAISSVDLLSEGTIAGDSAIIQIDSRLDVESLKSSKKSYDLLQQILKINQEILSGLEESYELKKSYFKRVNSLATNTATQKDNAYSAFIATKNQWLATKEKVVNLKKQILDLEYKIKKLEDTISKKTIKLKGRYIYKIMVRAGEYASPGIPLVIADDLSKAKVILFLDKDEIKNIDKKRAYIDGSEEGVKISRVWRVADEKFISAYKAEIILESKPLFSLLLKIDIR